jgi:hypothetical protein
MSSESFVCDICAKLGATKAQPCDLNYRVPSGASGFESNSILRRKMVQVGDKFEKLEMNFKVLLDAAKKVVEMPGKAAGIMKKALKQIGKDGLQLDSVTCRRLEDGERAMDLPAPKTKEEAQKFVHAMHDGAVALQSLDDLGDVMNKKAMADMDELDRRTKKVKKEFRLE